MPILSKQRKDKIIKNARQLRQNSTDVEKKIWQELRSNRFEGYKFRRQHDIGNYVVDFVCLQQKLLIELDGGQHSDQKEYDDERTKYLEGLGYKVLRFWNNEVMQNMEGVMMVISSYLTPHPNPLPEEGEGTTSSN
jgi:very-short-patch-repair endonuclease